MRCQCENPKRECALVHDRDGGCGVSNYLLARSPLVGGLNLEHGFLGSLLKRLKQPEVERKSYSKPQKEAAGSNTSFTALDNIEEHIYLQAIVEE